MSETPKHTHTTETENAPLLTWGEGNPILENHTGDLHCSNPECKFNFSPASILNDKGIMDKSTVGIQKAPFASRSGKEYAQILECPKCFTQSWIHIDEFSAGTIKMLKKIN